ncbi:MAG TPA: cysteine hydrolase [Propionibacteriaceae bacterium]|nr:cysteine hydrolase [Propionibacteriaceae bacterium]
MSRPWLVAIDLQVIFADPASAWCTPDFARAASATERLLPAFTDRVVCTRFVAPDRPTGAWVDYYADWPFALVPKTDPLYDLVPPFAGLGGPVVSTTTFGKWGRDLESVVDPDAPLVLTGVSTDCCVLSTALPAADAGRKVLVVADACAGLSEVDHQRALDAMALYAPLVTITDVDSVLRSAP